MYWCCFLLSQAMMGLSLSSNSKILYQIDLAIEQIKRTLVVNEHQPPPPALMNEPNHSRYRLEQLSHHTLLPLAARMCCRGVSDKPISYCSASSLSVFVNFVCSLHSVHSMSSTYPQGLEAWLELHSKCPFQSLQEG